MSGRLGQSPTVVLGQNHLPDAQGGQIDPGLELIAFIATRLGEQYQPPPTPALALTPPPAFV